MPKKIFVTGGAGYIGSHACLDLLVQDHDVIVFDSLVNGSAEALRRVEFLTKRGLKLVVGDIRDDVVLADAVKSFNPDSVIHFAGLKSVNESIADPILYYDVNVRGSLNLLKSMEQVGCNEFVFSSSATVYGDKNKAPYSENDVVAPVSPYGNSKLMVENILRDWVKSQKAKKAVILRYFNPVGSHVSGLIGEDPSGKPNNLMPLIVEVAKKKCDYLSIYGSDYDTRDGTGERDYIHVSDLAEGHVKAVENISRLNRYQVLNLGTGKSTSVKELIQAFEKSNGVSVPSRLTKRRSGDVAKSFANPALAFNLLGFECTRTIKEMCIDTWHWAQKNPNGYE